MMETLTTLATAAGLGVGAGVNAYATFLIYGLLARFFPSFVPTTESTAFLSSTPVLIVLGVLYTIEFLADKIPAIDHAWDAVHTFVRPLAGALIGFVSASPADSPQSLLAVASILGGTMALGSHVAKSSLRAVSTTTTAGTANPILSLVEDAFVIVQAVIAVFLPWVVLAMLLLIVLPGFFILLAYLKRRAERAPAR